MPLQMPHVSVCDSHSSLPQSKHCVLAVLEQGKPSASAEFLISMTSHRSGMGPSLRFGERRMPDGEKTCPAARRVQTYAIILALGWRSIQTASKA